MEETKELEKAKNRLAKLQQEKIALEKLKQTKLDPDNKIQKQDEVLQTIKKWSNEGGKFSRYRFYIKMSSYVFPQFFPSLWKIDSQLSTLKSTKNCYFSLSKIF